MSKKENRNENVEKLKKLGLLPENVIERRKDDLEKYLEEKVRKNEIIVKDLIKRFWEANPNFELKLESIDPDVVCPLKRINFHPSS